MSKWIILDRDGVINRDSDHFIKSVDEFVLLPGSAEAIARLCKAGYQVTVATNQSGVFRGLFTLDTLHAMHRKLRDGVEQLGGSITDIVYCPHGPEEGCECRKPKAGMYKTLAEKHGFGLENVLVVGDSLRDLQAAQRVKAKPVLVRTGKGERTLAKGEGLEGIPVYDNLAAVVDAVLDGSV